MSEEEILKKIDDIFDYCEEIDNHLPKEEQTGYRMLPDIFYIQKEVHKLQQKIEQLENIRKEAIGFTNSHFKEMVADEEAQALLSILNKGDNNVKDKR